MRVAGRGVGVEMGKPDRGEAILDAVFDDVNQRLNPNGDECWYCGGEGETYDCIDGCCVDAESGCPDCALPCLECRIYAARKAKMVREEVIRIGDIDVAVAWLKHVGRWHEGISPDRILGSLKVAAAALSSPVEA